MKNVSAFGIYSDQATVTDACCVVSRSLVSNGNESRRIATSTSDAERSCVAFESGSALRYGDARKKASAGA